MNIRLLPAVLCVSAGLACALPAVADAASLRLRCEQRVSPARAKISVDGRNVAANAVYSARVISGSRQVTAKPQTAVGDEVEFDFDSDPGDIRAGATAIPSRFIRNGSVRAAIFNSAGRVVAGPVTAACRVR